MWIQHIPWIITELLHDELFSLKDVLIRYLSRLGWLKFMKVLQCATVNEIFKLLLWKGKGKWKSEVFFYHFALLFHQSLLKIQSIIFTNRYVSGWMGWLVLWWGFIWDFLVFGMCVWNGMLCGVCTCVRTCVCATCLCVWVHIYIQLCTCLCGFVNAIWILTITI